MHWGRVAPGQCWPLDVPAALRPAAEALCTWPCEAPRSRCTDEQLCSTVHGQHRLEHRGSPGGCLPGHAQPGPMLRMCEKALIGHGLSHGRGSGAVWGKRWI